MNTQEANQRPLFPHLLTQCFNPPVIPQIGAKQPKVTSRTTRIQRIFSKIALNTSKRSTDSNFETAPSPKKLPRCSYGSMLPETPALFTDTASLTSTTLTNRSKRNRPYYSSRCNTMPSTEKYAIYGCEAKKCSASC